MIASIRNRTAIRQLSVQSNFARGAAMSTAGLTGRFWFRKSWTGKLVLLVEEERPRWFGGPGETKRRWRDAKLLDLAEAPMRTLLTLERTYRVEHPVGPARVVQTALPAGVRGTVVPPPAP
jgi:hypothetical protein